MNRRRLIAAASLAPLLPPLADCGRDDLSGEWYSDWDLAGGCTSEGPAVARLDALGRPADICPSDPTATHWTWVMYGGAWCSASRSQAGRMRDFDQRCREWMEVLTVLTGAEPLQLPTRGDALAWASATGLPPERVLFAPTEVDTRIVPQHLLLSPEGRTLYRFNGVLGVDEMLDLAVGFRMGLRQPKLRRLPSR